MESESRVVAVSLPHEYPIVLLMACLLSFECLLVGFCCVGAARRSVYGNAEVEKKIELLHLQEMGRELRNVKGGAPDGGDGRFSTPEMLNHAQWLKINKAQRLHMDFLNQLGSVIVLTLISGFEFPIITCIFAGLYGGARLLYLLPNRNFGHVSCVLCLSLLVLGALYSSIKLVVDVTSLGDSGVQG